MSEQLVLIALALVAATTMAHADADTEAWELLQRGTALYQKGDYAAAREPLAHARQLVPDRVPNIYRWLGLADAHLGRCADAVAELDRFLASSPVEAPVVAEATTARDECKKALATRGVLRVETTPGGAEVRIDTDDPKTPPLGLSPLQTEAIPPGDHLVSMRLAGFQSASRIASIVTGQVATVQLSFTSFAPPVSAPVERPVWKRRWFWPVVAGAVVLVGVAVGVGVGVGTQSKPTYPMLVFQ